MVTVRKPNQNLAASTKIESSLSTVLVKASAGHTYAGVQGKIRLIIDTGTCTTNVVCASLTPKGMLPSG